MEFPYLAAEDVECRVSTINEKGLSLLLYKDARCDQNILDKTVGPLNWQRRHSRDNANCTVEIWDEAKCQWIGKEDTGTESYTEKEKGLASDSFKRACFNWGIGRELYTAPFIWIPVKDKDGNFNYDAAEKSGKTTTYDRFVCTFMKVENGKIVGLNIENLKKRKTVFVFGDILPDANSVSCEICGKPVQKEFAEKSITANGRVFCSGTCKAAAQ